MKAFQQVIYWVIVSLLMIVTFAYKSGDYVHAIYFVSMLIPIAIGTSWFFNHHLIPRYLFKEKYGAFVLYFIYSLILSLYFEMVVLTISFIVLANYQYENLNPYAADLLILTTVIYLFVFINGFIIMIQRVRTNESLLDQLKQDKDRSTMEQIVIKVDRKSVPILLNELLYIESLGDYVKVVTSSNQCITKEKISQMQALLPLSFLRVHRAFLINSAFVDSFTHDTVTVAKHPIPISRTYKKSALSELGIRSKNKS